MQRKLPTTIHKDSTTNLSKHTVGYHNVKCAGKNESGRKALQIYFKRKVVRPPHAYYNQYQEHDVSQ